MKNKLNIKIGFVAFLFAVALSSCLEYNLPELPLYEGSEITLVSVEHRFNGSQTMHGQPIVAYQKLTVSQQINKDAGTVNVQISVPGPTEQFTAEEREKVVQTHLWFYVNISTAATIKPIEGTPKLGDPSDATKALKYEITAANGSKKIWTINVTAFDK